jgi:hypothetical protein
MTIRASLITATLTGLILALMLVLSFTAAVVHFPEMFKTGVLLLLLWATVWGFWKTCLWISRNL